MAWLAVESDKPGRAPEGGSILLAQMAAPGPTRHYDDDRETLVAAAAQAVSGVWGPVPDADLDRHPALALLAPRRGRRPGALAEAADLGLFVAGDSTAGKGRVHLAMDEGRAAAERIRQRG